MFSKRFLLSQIFFVITAALLFFIYARSQAPKLPILGQVQDFELTNSEGQKVRFQDLKGKIWVADFFFTTCSDICPMMSTHMGRLHKIFKPYADVRLVSFTVNPENDTPEALKTYAKKYQADTNQWIFLTGSREEITQVAVKSFKMGDIKEPIFHSSYFTLVDKQGRIRGYYDTSDTKNIDRVTNDLLLLLKAG
jgi:protein SCO1